MRKEFLALTFAIGAIVGTIVAQSPSLRSLAAPTLPATGSTANPLQAVVGHTAHIDLRNSDIAVDGGRLVGIDGQVASVEDGWLTLVTDGKLNPKQPVVHVPIASVELLWSSGAAPSTTRP